MSRRGVIQATGSYLPERIMTNHDLEKIVDTSDEWIRQRSGIIERRIAADNETTADMAIAAAQETLNSTEIKAQDIDCVIVATTTPDQTFPSVAVKVQKALGIPAGIAFDVQAVCTGFVYALGVANSFIISRQAKNILVIGADKMSSILNWEDRTTCVLFADGAGAVILSAEEQGEDDKGARGIISSHLYADGAHKDILYVDGGPSSTGTTGHIVMQGKEVFKHAVTNMAEVVEEALSVNNLKAEQIDWLVPHQANIRIIESTAKKLKLPMEKVIVTVERHGNTSAASIPLALDEGVKDGRIKKGDMVLLEGMGGGLTWGAVLVRF
ncbi:MAG: beta-ketoacyl-ACP synthase III [Alphaproteobacteria bacterium]